ncbi:unnamed protein product [Rotaria sordida]|uniref:Uncharacterized protein n=1 Tax=Rotaria sordida TaxID=392033 RepID=A0A815L446_9BILA|nr:unnamed protein product [Rotaria sordida]
MFFATIILFFLGINLVRCTDKALDEHFSNKGTLLESILQQRRLIEMNGIHKLGLSAKTLLKNRALTVSCYWGAAHSLPINYNTLTNSAGWEVCFYLSTSCTSLADSKNKTSTHLFTAGIGPGSTDDCNKPESTYIQNNYQCTSKLTCCFTNLCNTASGNNNGNGAYLNECTKSYLFLIVIANIMLFSM